MFLTRSCLKNHKSLQTLSNSPWKSESVTNHPTDRGWLVGGKQKTANRKQKSEIRKQKSENLKQKAENKKTENRKLMGGLCQDLNVCTNQKKLLAAQSISTIWSKFATPRNLSFEKQIYALQKFYCHLSSLSLTS